jgi:hypothetical protein
MSADLHPDPLLEGGGNGFPAAKPDGAESKTPALRRTGVSENDMQRRNRIIAGGANDSSTRPALILTKTYAYTADAARTDGGWIHATGVRRIVGDTYREVPDRSWPTQMVREVRWVTPDRRAAA